MPFFTPTSIDIQVYENASVNSVLYTVSATDKDLKDSLTYDIISSDSVNTFSLDTSTGVLTLLQALDRENISSYQLKFEAKDSARLLSPDPLTLKIMVKDVNDNAPKFLRPFYYTDVVENTPDGTIILTVLATDADVGINKEITYSFLQDVSNYFHIDSTRGLISKEGRFQGTARFLNFTVVATDHGIPPKSSQVSCSVRWVEVNDGSPRFNQSQFSVSVREDVPVGTQVLILTAFDPSQNEKITYFLTGGQGKFVVDSVTVSIAKYFEFPL